MLSGYVEKQKSKKNEEMEIQKNVFLLLCFLLVVSSLIVEDQQSRAEAQFRLIRAIYIENCKHL